MVDRQLIRSTARRPQLYVKPVCPRFRRGVPRNCVSQRPIFGIARDWLQRLVAEREATIPTSPNGPSAHASPRSRSSIPPSADAWRSSALPRRLNERPPSYDWRPIAGGSLSPWRNIRALRLHGDRSAAWRPALLLTACPRDITDRGHRVVPALRMLLLIGASKQIRKR